MTRPDRVAYLDTETTGLLDDEQARVVEVGIAVFETATGQLLDTFESLVQPDVLTDEGLAICERVSGITFDMIQSAPIPEEVYDDIRQFLERWTLPVRCWNIEFDQAMFRRSLCHPDPALAEQYDQVLWYGCVMTEWTTRFGNYVMTHEGSGKKTFFSIPRARKLCEVKGILLSWEGEPHRALADAIMTGRLDHVLTASLVVPDVMPSIQVNPGQILRERKWPRWWECVDRMPATGSFNPAEHTRPELPSTGSFSPKRFVPRTEHHPMPTTGTFNPLVHR